MARRIPPLPAGVLIPDGTIGTSDRADLLYLYAGIALGAPIVDALAHLTATIIAQARIEASVTAEAQLSGTVKVNQ